MGRRRMGLGAAWVALAFSADVSAQAAPCGRERTYTVQVQPNATFYLDVLLGLAGLAARRTSRRAALLARR